MRFAFCAVYAFMGGLLFALPNMTRRELLFAVPVPPDFRQRREGRSAIRTFRAVVAAAGLAGLAALLAAPGAEFGAIVAVAQFGLMAAALGCFAWLHLKLVPAAVQFSGPRQAELSTEPDRLPRFTWLAAGPFVLLAAAAAWLAGNWDRIPARFPVHWGFGGQPDRWAERTARGVYGPMLFGAELCAWMLIVGVVGWYGARRSPSRRLMLGAMIAIGYMLASVFAMVALNPVLGIPVWLVVVAPMAFLIPMIAILVRKWSEPADPPEPTPNECWKAGVFYYNPEDSALFVEKRGGFGYTLNFGNPWCWVFLGSLVVVLASAPLIVG